MSQALAAQARAVIARHGDLTLPQWRIIRLISMDVAQGSTAIRKTLHIDKGQFSKTVNVLVERGYVTTRPWVTDKRQFDIELTDMGEAALALLAPDLDKRHRHLLAALADAQRYMLEDILKALNEAAQDLDFLDRVPE